MKTKSAFLTVLFCTFMAMLSPPAHAWDGIASGKIATYEVVALEGGGTNYDFRVHLEGVTSMCNGGAGNWAYINVGAGNYKALTAALMIAHATGKTVAVYSNRGTQNYCQIGHIQVN